MSTVDFFISYNHHDSAWAEWIAWQLEEGGYTTIIQAWDFTASSNFVLEMDRGLKDAERLIAVLSRHYFESRFTSAEWATAFAQGPENKRAKIVPVRVERIHADGLLSPIVYIDLVEKDETAARHELLSKVRGERTKPLRAPVFPGKSKPAFPGLSQETLAAEAQVQFTAVITGTITADHKALVEALVAHFRKISRDASVTLLEVRKGSVVLVMRCSRAGFERLQMLFQSGQLKRVFDFELTELRISDEREHETATPLDVSTLISALLHGDADLRANALDEAKRRSAIVVPELINVLQQDKNVLNRVSAVETLGEIVPVGEDVLFVLANVLRRGDAALVWMSAIEVLGRFGQSAMPTLTEALRFGYDDEVRKAAASKLGKLGPGAVPILMEAVHQQENKGVRDAVVAALGQIGPPSAPPLVDALRSEKSPILRSSIIQTLESIGRAAVRALSEASSWDKTDGDQLAAIEVLKRSAAGVIIPALTEQLGPHNGAELQTSLIAALRLMWTAVMPELTKAWMRHMSQRVRVEAAQTIKALGLPIVGKLAEVLQEGRDGQVRLAAAKALGDIGRTGAKSLAVASTDYKAVFESMGPESVANTLFSVLIHDADPNLASGILQSLIQIYKSGFCRYQA